MNKKRLAKEWLNFLGLLFIGGVGLPVLLAAIFAERARFWHQLGLNYAALVDKREFWTAWLLALGPYLLFQLARSVVWAWKTARS